MNHLRVVHRHTDKASRWKGILKAVIGSLMIALAVSIGSIAVVESIKYVCNILIK